MTLIFESADGPSAASAPGAGSYDSSAAASAPGAGSYDLSAAAPAYSALITSSISTSTSAPGNYGDPTEVDLERDGGT